MNREERNLRGELAQAEDAAKGRLPWRERVYGKLKVSVATMDKIIIAVVVLLGIVLLLGVITGNR
ncbi:MAG: hypothetical protein PHP02_06980 [Eubacteriales bacterium]|nr:hypothetical protein [Eubacteriales bacterium]